jgi:hypothetical protein
MVYRSAKRDATKAFEEAFESSKRRHTARLGDKNQYVDTFKEALAKYLGSCAFCQMFHKQNPKHSILRCYTMLHDVEGTSKDHYLNWKRKLSYDDKLHSKICYFCHIPQCNDLLHPTFGSGCEHEDVVGPIGYGVYMNPDWKTGAEKEFGVCWPNIVDFVAWLNGPPCKGHQSNLSALFLWYTQNAW